MSEPKRKHVVATIMQKLEILDMLDEGVSARNIAKAFNIGTSTVHDIKTKRYELREFSVRHCDAIYGAALRKTMKRSPYELLNRAALHWFNQERSAGRKVNGPQLIAHARQLFVSLGLPGKFDASAGWLSRFKDRYGIRTIGDSMDCIFTKSQFQQDQPSGNNVSAVSPNDNKANSSENILDPERKEQDNILNVEQNSIDTNIFNVEKESTTLDASSINLQSSDNQITAFNSDQEDFMGFETDDNENITPNKSADHQEELLGINIKDFESLKTVVRKLEVLSEKLSESTKTDSFDQFGKYVTSLLRGLPKHKALLLKQKIVSDILDAILDNNQPSSKAPLSNNINNATTMAATNKIYPNHQVNSICDDRLLINTSAQHINKDKAIHSRGKLLTKSNDQPSTLKLNILPYPENPSGQTHITSSDISSTKGNNKNLFNCFPSIRSTKQDSSQVFKRASTTIGPNQCSSSTSFCIESTDSLQCNSRSTSSEVYESNSSSGVQHFSPSEAVLTPTRKKRPKKRKLSVPKSLDKDTVYQASSSIKMENVGETCDIPSDHRCFEIVMCDGPGTLEIKEEPLEIIDQLHSDCTKSQEFECALCSACFQSKDLLILHFRQHHEGCIPSIKQDR